MTHLPVKQVQDGRRAFQVMEREMTKILEEKRAAFVEDGEGVNGEVRKDLISILCE